MVGTRPARSPPAGTTADLSEGDVAAQPRCGRPAARRGPTGGVARSRPRATDGDVAPGRLPDRCGRRRHSRGGPTRHAGRPALLRAVMIAPRLRYAVTCPRARARGDRRRLRRGRGVGRALEPDPRRHAARAARRRRAAVRGRGVRRARGRDAPGARGGGRRRLERGRRELPRGARRGDAGAAGPRERLRAGGGGRRRRPDEPSRPPTEAVPPPTTETAPPTTTEEETVDRGGASAGGRERRGGGFRFGLGVGRSRSPVR